MLDKELFEYTKPGLSSFAKEPEKVILNVEIFFYKLTSLLGFE